MCYFHVLYNGRKKTPHLSAKMQILIVKDITRIHYSETLGEYTALKVDALNRWRAKLELAKFTEYFEQQWLTGKYWRWQAFHSLLGYATTNNPCEVFNASTKRFYARRSYHMQHRLQKLLELFD